MLRYLIISVIIIGSFTASKAQLSLFSSDLQNGFKALEKGNYSKAIKYFNDVVKDDSSKLATNYGFAVIYFSKDYDGYDINKAIAYITKSLNNYEKLDEKQLTALNKLNIDRNKIEQLKLKIDDELFSNVVAENSIEAYNKFIADYPGNANVSKAKELKGQLLFYQSKSGNSPDAINDFIKNNPNSKDLKKAINMRNMLNFQKAKASNTVHALQEFIEKYPDASQREEAILALIAIELIEAKKSNTVEGYDNFLLKYPESEQAKEASMLRNQIAYIQLLEEQKNKDKIELRQQQLALETQSLRLNFSIIGSVLLLLLAGLLYRGYYQKKRSHKAITEQKEIIEAKNKEIIDSINYAKRIQESMLPMLSEIKKSLPESFIFYKPRNIVSGDFYWFTSHEDKLIIAAADCTGHGVPGALVSMIGFNFLSQLVNELNITEPGKILDQLHIRISHALNKDQDPEARGLRDGMDIALLSIDKKNSMVSYAGAARPLCYIDDEGLKVIKGGYYSIGGIKPLTGQPFPTYNITLKKNTNFYLFSDGFADQFGGNNGKKFKVKKLQELLLSIKDKKMNEQGKEIETSFINWMGDNDQVDDVCIIGLRI